MASQIVIRKITEVAEMLPHFSLIQLLSPQLDMVQYENMLHDMVPHNYGQMAAFEGETCIAVSGYWLGTKLYCGKYIEIDNFIVHPDHRARGTGKLLLDRILDEGRANDCNMAMLDAYVENFRAHHFYYREGFIARGYHFLRQI